MGILTKSFNRLSKQEPNKIMFLTDIRTNSLKYRVAALLQNNSTMKNQYVLNGHEDKMVRIIEIYPHSRVYFRITSGSELFLFGWWWYPQPIQFGIPMRNYNVKQTFLIQTYIQRQTQGLYLPGTTNNQLNNIFMVIKPLIDDAVKIF